MFRTHCDTVRCKNKPSWRVVRHYTIKCSTGRVKELHTDKELCNEPGCIGHALDQMYEPETIRGTWERIP